MEEDEPARLDNAPTIRECLDRDLDSVLEIERECFRFPYDRETFVRFLCSRSACFLVCVIGDAVVGYVVSDRRAGGVGSIVSIAVSPAHRRRGIGSMLLDSAIAELEDEVQVIELQVAVSNCGAIDFYNKKGFKTIKVLRGYYPDGEDAYLMTLRPS
jgi:ribosomal-protein-alanine N-acetyltransferase